MYRTSFIIAAAFLWLWCQAASGAEQALDEIKVVANGTGIDVDGAIRQALKNAVQQAVGTMVDSETIVDHERVIKDEILTASGAIVTKYEQVGAPTVEAGLTTITIKALVRGTDLRQRLEKASVVSKPADGKNLFAQAVTELEKERDAAKIVRRMFDGFPGNVLKVELVGETEPLSRTQAEATLGVQVHFSIDQVKYAAWYDSFVPILAKAAARAEEHRWNPEQMGAKALEAKHDEPMTGHKSVLVPQKDFAQGYGILGAKTGLPESTFGKRCLAIYERQGSTRITLLYLDDAAYTEAVKGAYAVPMVSVRLKDGKDKELDGQTMPAWFGSVPPICATPFYFHAMSGAPWMRFEHVISDPPPDMRELERVQGPIAVHPYFEVEGRWAFERPLVTGFTTQFQFRIPLDRLNAMRSVEAKIDSRNYGKSALGANDH